MDEGFSVKLMHDEEENHSTIGDVRVTTADGAVLAQCRGFQTNQNLNNRERLSSQLTKEAANKFEGQSKYTSTGEMETSKEDCATAGADEKCCGKKKEIGKCCGEYKTAARVEEKGCSSGGCGSDAKVGAENTGSCSMGRGGDCCLSTPQMICVGLALVMALVWYFSAGSTSIAESPIKEILPDGFESNGLPMNKMVEEAVSVAQ